MQLAIFFSFLSLAFAFPTQRPLCTPTQLRNVALNLTLEYQGYITACEFVNAQNLASMIAVGRTNEPDCPGDVCCQSVSALPDFNAIHYGECAWTVQWVNATPLISGAQIGQCGDVSVFATTTETNIEDPTNIRNYYVEFVWRPQCGVTGCVPNCALELVDIKYNVQGCDGWDVPRCSNCPP